jgi:hypothetical protein
MHPALKLVSDRLPNVRDQAALLFDRDEVFRELCDEYQMCDETVERIEATPAADAGLQREYVALRLRLEGELLRYLMERR